MMEKEWSIGDENIDIEKLDKNKIELVLNEAKDLVIQTNTNSNQLDNKVYIILGLVFPFMTAVLFYFFNEYSLNSLSWQNKLSIGSFLVITAVSAINLLFGIWSDKVYPNGYEPKFITEKEVVSQGKNLFLAAIIDDYQARINKNIDYCEGKAMRLNISVIGFIFAPIIALVISLF